MSSDDEDELCRFGTPLDPIEEDEVPSAKKITLADQIAVDSNGRRRFHGAFTGGFSAGFWNTVGSREGWVPSEFKSSRGEKATRRMQQASDFMDEEDVGEFGIAPQRIQTTDDFGPDARQRNKRKLQSNSTAQGPIPGIPVLELVLESCRDKAAVRLLKRMDKRYAATLTEKPKKSFSKPTEEDVDGDEQMSSKENDEPADSSAATADAAAETTDHKVYKCDMGPIQRPTKSHQNASDGSDTDDDDEDDDDDDDGDEDDLIFDTDEYDTIFNNLKSNRFGLSYVGLEKGDFFTTVGSEVPNIQNNFSILPTFTMVDQNRKKVTIRGQAFGVGAFEEDDDDIYGRDDMTKYDFRLDTQKDSGGPSKSGRNVERGYISAFAEAKQTPSRITTKNVFRVKLPYGYEPRNWLKRKSRFGPETIATTSTAVIKGPADKVIGRHDLTPDQRGQILGDKKKETIILAATTSIDIDAKLKAAGLKTMSFTSGGVENKTDDPTSTTHDLSSKIDETLAKFRNKSFVVPESIPEICDRFTTSNDAKPLSELDSTDSKKSEEIPAAENVTKEFQKVKRTKSTWIPCQLLCYKMNMETSVGAKPEKGNTFSLFECIANTEAARRNRLEFTSVKHDERDVYESQKIDDKSHEKSKQVSITEASKKPEQQQQQQQQYRAEEPPPPVASTTQPKPIDMLETSSSQIVETTKPEIPIVKRNKPKTELEMKILQTQDEHPSKKKDIFKAIFDSSGESEDSDNDEADSTSKSSATTSVAADVLASLTKPSSSAMASMYSQLPDDAFRPKSAREINILRNTSPPRGIFSGLIKKPEPQIKIDSDRNEPIDNNNAKSIENDKQEPDIYGPSLPPPKFTTPQSTVTSSSSSAHNGNKEKSSVASISLGKHSDVKVVYKEKWIEKTDEKEKKSKKEKKHKKDRDKHKSKKQKKEKHKKKKR